MLLVPPGVGETHLAVSLAVAAAERGRHLYFTTLAYLLHSFEEAQNAGRLTPRLRTLVFPSLMVIDEIGYLPITRIGAMLFFQLLSRRYESGSTILTSNKSFEEWGDIFGDEVTSAGSWRMRSGRHSSLHTISGKVGDSGGSRPGLHQPRRVRAAGLGGCPTTRPGHPRSRCRFRFSGRAPPTSWKLGRVGRQAD